MAEARLYEEGKQPRCILFVVPGSRRLETLQCAFGRFERERTRRSSLRSVRGLEGPWPLLVSTTIRLRADGPLAAVWDRLDLEYAPEAIHDGGFALREIGASLAEPIDGRFPLPTAPGLGVELDDERLSYYAAVARGIG